MAPADTACCHAVLSNATAEANERTSDSMPNLLALNECDLVNEASETAVATLTLLDL